MVFSFALVVLVTVGRPDVQEYDEYQYDEPQEGFEEALEEKEVATNEKFEMITKPLNIVAVAGERIELPCMVDKLPSKVTICQYFLLISSCSRWCWNNLGKT